MDCPQKNACDIATSILNSSVLNTKQLMPTRRAGHMQYWQIEDEHHRQYFLKIATGERTKKMISEEVVFYEVAGKQTFLPDYYGEYRREDCAAILIEDLSRCSWAPPWTQKRIEQVISSLEKFRTLNLPQITRKASDFRGYLLGWSKTGKRLAVLEESGINDLRWLEKKIPLFSDISEKALHPSNDLIHFDVRSDNACFRNDEALLLDWTWYCRGAFDLQMASWALTLSLEDGGIAPEYLLPKIDPCYVALIAGYFSQFVGQPCQDGSHVRQLQFRQLVVALEWLKKIV